VTVARSRARGTPWGVGVLFAMSAGCSDVAEPRPQWLVHVSTDAPLPQLADRLLVEVVDDDGDVCDACRRELGAASEDEWPLSFGVAAPADGGRWRLRLRLYRARAAGVDGLPTPPLLIDLLAVLPPADGVTDVEASLAMGCFGQPADVVADRSCVADTGLVGPVAELPRGDGAGEAPEGMVCIPGGVFLLGSVEYLPYWSGDAAPEQLVQLSPFWLDRDEMTFERLEPLLALGLQPPVARDSAPGADLCAYVPGASDGAASVNCVSRAVAGAACELLGLRLPTEAEWEYAAGNLGQETAYPWTADDAAPTEDICAHAHVARGRVGEEYVEATTCLAPGESGGPATGGAPDDVTELGVRNLAGNLTELVADDFAPYLDPACWAGGATLLTDPVCAQSNASLHSTRGGAWDALPFSARVSERGATGNGFNAAVGFRCARSASAGEVGP
jgi:sulfatase modifying factor 1